MTRAVLVELLVQEDSTLAFMLSAETTRLTRLSIRKTEVFDWTNRILGLMRQRDQSGTVLKSEQTPFDPLLDAIVEESDPGDVLCFVPHGPLHLVPFHALALPDGPLIRRNPVVYAPSASVLASVVDRKVSGDHRGAIVLGDTRGDLPYARDEARAVAELLGVQPIPGREATRGRLLHEISMQKKLRILHLACHGYFDVQDPWSSGIIMAGDEISKGDTVLSARDLLERQVGADLISLSACESGVSEQEPGDELVGLTRALLIAGARSVIASLWKVNDLSTSILMGKFYQSWLKEKLPKAEALRRAQCYAMDLTAEDIREIHQAQHRPISDRDLSLFPNGGEPTSDEKVFAAPRHWAAFTLVGDWR
jgi:CHAT domain-containing protein